MQNAAALMAKAYRCGECGREVTDLEKGVGMWAKNAHDEKADQQNHEVMAAHGIR